MKVKCKAIFKTKNEFAIFNPTLKALKRGIFQAEGK